jgi:hypothetical protein
MSDKSQTTPPPIDATAYEVARDFGAGHITEAQCTELVTIIEHQRSRIARLEGYSEGLRDKLTAVRRAAGCNHD